MTEYTDALHAMQTAVEFNPDKGDQTPKQLRVGINALFSDAGGLATLLIEKGIFTREEYEVAVTEAMKREVDMHRKRLAENYGMDADKIELY